MKSRLHDQMNMGVSAIRQLLRQNVTSEENTSAIVQFRRAIVADGVDYLSISFCLEDGQEWYFSCNMSENVINGLW